MREGIGRPGGGSGGGGMGVFGDGPSLPRPSKYSNVMYSDPLIKSTSEEDFSNRNSSASVASPGYYSDRIGTALSPESSPYTMSPWNHTPSPLAISPWSHPDTINPFSSAPSDVSTTSLFPPGTGLVGSLVREEGHIYSLAAAGDLLYTGSDSKNIRVWKNQKEHSGFKAGSGLVKAIVISGDRIFTGHQDGKIRVWKPSPKNPRSHKRVSTLPRLKDFLKSSLNPTNYVEARRRNHRSAVWIRHADAVSCLSPSEDHSLLYSGSWDRTIKVWRVADSRCLESIGAHDDAVNSVVASFDGLVFSGSADGTVKVWRREMTGKGTRHAAVQTLLKQECAVTALAVNRALSVVYCGSSDGVINFWDRERQQLSHGGMLHGHKMAVLCLAVAGSLLFTGSADKTICVWHREGSGAHVCLSVMTGHTGPVKCLAVEADPAAGARMLVVYSGSLDKSVKVWKVADPAPAPAEADGGRQAPEQLQRRSDTTSSYEHVGGPRFDKY